MTTLFSGKGARSPIPEPEPPEDNGPGIKQLKLWILIMAGVVVAAAAADPYIYN